MRALTGSEMATGTSEAAVVIAINSTRGRCACRMREGLVMNCNRSFEFVFAAALGIFAVSVAVGAPPTTQRVEHFERDPVWEGFNNRVTRNRYPAITQDFGYADGRIGGQVWR